MPNSKRLAWVNPEKEWPLEFVLPEEVFDDEEWSDGQCAIKRVKRYSSKGHLNEKEVLVLSVASVIEDETTNTQFASTYHGYKYATGNVILLGIGLGTLLIPLAERQCVHSVTVFEPYKSLSDYVLEKWDGLLQNTEKGKIKVVHAWDDLPNANWVICRHKAEVEYASKLAKGIPAFVYFDNELTMREPVADKSYFRALHEKQNAK